MDFTIKDYDLRDSFKIEKKMLLLSGFYPRRDNKHNILYVFSALFNLSVSYAQLFSMIVHGIIVRDDLTKFAEVSLLFITHFTFLCKLTNFGYYRNSLFDIEDMLAEPILYGSPYNQLQYLKKKIATCEIIAKTFRIMCAICISFYLLVPYIDEKEKSLPLPGWFPYNTTIYYFPSVTFQCMSIAISAYNNSSIDTLTWMLITVAAAEFNLLKNNLKNINYLPDHRVTVNNSIKNYFNYCVKHHMAITRLVQKIEDIFSKGIFLQFAASVIVICFTGFQIMIVPVPSIEFIFLILYFACMMCQCAMYCWYGHDVMTTSNEIGRYFYMSNWYESDIELRKNMIIFLERTKRPVTLTAGKFVTLTLPTLTGILQSSYSYFAVLQHVYKTT